VTKPYKYHFHMDGWLKTLCNRELSTVQRLTGDLQRVNCTACKADPFLANRDTAEPAPPLIKHDGPVLTLEFTDPELASIFRDWLESKEINGGWPGFGTWYDGKR
jgi:hypothetical protein